MAAVCYIEGAVFFPFRRLIFYSNYEKKVRFAKLYWILNLELKNFQTNSFEGYQLKLGAMGESLYR